MKTKILIALVSVLVIFAVPQTGCKNMAKAAAKYWTKKQIKKFKAKCNESAIAKWNKEKGEQFCDCATDIIMEKYKNYDEAEKLDFTAIIVAAKSCALGN
ncbi:MAG: hypothetical protein ACOZCO_13130 [Bacteroidota bacterium]